MTSACQSFDKLAGDLTVRFDNHKRPGKKRRLKKIVILVKPKKVHAEQAGAASR